MQKPQCSMRWLFDYSSSFVINFLCYVFQKQASKGHLTQGNLLKAMVLIEKESNLEKEMYGNKPTYLFTPNIFHQGQEVIITKHTFKWWSTLVCIFSYLVEEKK